MNRKNVVYVALLGLLLGYVSQTQAGSVIGVPTVPPSGGGSGGGGTNSNGLPESWSVYSGSSNRGASAYGGISGNSMGIPDYVQSDIDWHYQDAGDGGGVGNTAGSSGELFFTVNFYSGGDVEAPNQSVNMGTAGGVTLNNVTLEKFEEDGESYIFFAFNEEVRINWSGNYSSYLYDGGAGGSLFGSASVSPTGSLIATPRLEFNQFEDPNQEPWWFNDYNAGIQITGYIPETMYTMSIASVPEPATLVLLAISGGAFYYRRRKEVAENKTA